MHFWKVTVLTGWRGLIGRNAGKQSVSVKTMLPVRAERRVCAEVKWQAVQELLRKFSKEAIQNGI